MRSGNSFVDLHSRIWWTIQGVEVRCFSVGTCLGEDKFCRVVGFEFAIESELSAVLINSKPAFRITTHFAQDQQNSKRASIEGERENVFLHIKQWFDDQIRRCYPVSFKPSQLFWNLELCHFPP